MKATLLRMALPVVCLLSAALPAQEPAKPASPSYFQTLVYIKTPPGKGPDYVQFSAETTRKLMQSRANVGEIFSWTLLRAVMPVGQEARADYLVSILSEGSPRPPLSNPEMDEALKKAGIAMSAEEYIDKRASLTTLVAQEMWRIMSRVGAPQKGHYLVLNHMKVKDAAAYTEFERTVWQPMAEEWVRQGAMSGWIHATKMLPSGTETPYSAYTADMYPSWKTAFAEREPLKSVFEKVHAGKNYNETFENGMKLRELARRELWVVVDRVEKSTGQTPTQ